MSNNQVNGQGVAPYQVNVTFRNNEIGKVVVNNAASSPWYGSEVAGASSNGGTGDTIQFNLASQEQDVEQENEQRQRATIRQQTGDTFSIAIDSGPGDAVAVAVSEHDLEQDAEIDQEQNARNRNEQSIRQRNRD